MFGNREASGSSRGRGRGLRMDSEATQDQHDFPRGENDETRMNVPRNMVGRIIGEHIGSVICLGSVQTYPPKVWH